MKEIVVPLLLKCESSQITERVQHFEKYTIFYKLKEKQINTFNIHTLFIFIMYNAEARSC